LTRSRIVVTGAAGFIGSNLSKALLARGYEVVGVDNLSQGHELNTVDLLPHPRFELHRVDIRDERAFASAAEGCDVIVHLAAFKIPRYSDALDTLLINSLGSNHAAKIAVANGAKLIAASTSDVYGKNPDVPFSETSDLVMGSPDVKRWAYAISKMFEEQLLFAYRDRFGIAVSLVRFFGGYGPNQNLTWWGGPQSVFINSALDDTEIEIHGDGKQTRSFTYVSDHVEGVVKIIESEAANGKVVNIGGTQEISIEELARLIWRLVRDAGEPKLRYVPYTSFGKYEDVRRRVPDISLARRLLGFEPSVDLESGLRLTIEWQVARRRRLAELGGQLAGSG
jgi:UDP-glucose 4-epimerase